MLRNLLIGLFLSSTLIMSCNPPKETPSQPTVEVEPDVDESTGIAGSDLDIGDSANDDDSADGPSSIDWTDCGGNVGDKACDFTFVDQNGDAWNLYDHYGTVMIIDFSTIWCGVCRTIAGDVQMHQDTFTAQGYDFLWVTVLVDGSTWGASPTQLEINDWVSTYGMTTSPVLLGDRSVIDTTAADGYPVTGWPTIVIIDETMTIAHGINGWNETTVFNWLETVLQNASQ